MYACCGRHHYMYFVQIALSTLEIFFTNLAAMFDTHHVSVSDGQVKAVLCLNTLHLHF